ncbi:DUF2461 domain-containing protein [Arthrobacter sp. ZGTC131]|uniref:DUF2461 domain-containing protein n=1 Tax=Arthrobacter sp. ZGTC131 TaxID=2058898 RepID=UPI000CE4A2D4|nr:DUF2461 domain-containing protein [Arthrobacter sp. ZGTC131]
MSTFEGIPVARAAAFYTELEENNTRDWWQAHSTVYQESVKEPLTALLARLEPQFGPSKIFRPHRDVRFSQDKSPYKTAQGAFASFQEGVGYYLQLSADGLLVGGGYHSHSPAQLARYRNSVDATGTGEQLQHIVEAIAAAGFTVEGEKLKTVPRGFPREHPRAELLKHKSLSASVALGQPDWLSSPDAEEEIARLWDKLRPLVDWVGRNAAP